MDNCSIYASQNRPEPDFLINIWVVSDGISGGGPRSLGYGDTFTRTLLLVGRMGSEKGCHFGARFDEETQLMLRAVAGDVIAFARLYEKYLPIITAYLVSLNGCYTSMEDLTQEIFARLWQNRAQFRARSTVKNYIYGILRNILSDHKKRLSKQISIKNGRFPGGFSVRRDGLSEPESEVYRMEIKEAVEQAMSKLTTGQNEAIRLFYFEQMTSSNSKAMAEHADCSTEAFRSRLRRAHSQLRQFLSNIEP